MAAARQGADISLRRGFIVPRGDLLIMGMVFPGAAGRFGLFGRFVLGATAAGMVGDSLGRTAAQQVVMETVRGCVVRGNGPGKRRQENVELKQQQRGYL